jgi:hypothetical protein
VYAVQYRTGSLGLFGLLVLAAAATDGEGSGRKTRQDRRLDSSAPAFARPWEAQVRRSPTLPGDQTPRPWFPNFEISNLYGPPPLGPKRWCSMHEHHDGFSLPGSQSAQPEETTNEGGGELQYGGWGMDGEVVLLELFNGMEAPGGRD